MIGKSQKSESQSTPLTAAPGASRNGEPRAARLYEVEIAGVPLRLKSLHDEQTVNELVALVDRKVRDALPLTKTGSIQNASILASLHLAEECLSLRHRAKVELERLETKALKMISELESSHVSGLQTHHDRGKGSETGAHLIQDFKSTSDDNQGGVIHNSNDTVDDSVRSPAKLDV